MINWLKNFFRKRANSDMYIVRRKGDTFEIRWRGLERNKPGRF
jgi:hypothetical protein